MSLVNWMKPSVNQPVHHSRSLIPQAMARRKLQGKYDFFTMTQQHQYQQHDVACSNETSGQASQVTKDLSQRSDSLSSKMMKSEHRPVIMGFRRCSLDHHARHHPIAVSSKDDTTISTSSSSLTVATEEMTRQPRRSSLKSSSSTSRPTRITPKKCVAFSRDVRVKEIEFRDQDYIQAAWLSKEERQDIQYRARADLKVIKHLTKHPEDKNTPGFRAVRSNISLRGLEQFLSKRIQQCLILEQQDVIYSVLEAQELQFQCSSHFGTLYGPEELAKVSAERSLPSCDRALRQGKEDEAAALSYLGLSTRKKSSSHLHLPAERPSSIPAAAPRAYKETPSPVAETSSDSSRSLKTL